MTNATTVSPSLQAVRESQIPLSTFMASNISKADLFALTIPAKHVNLRIANAAVVSGTFTAAITTAHRLPSLRLSVSPTPPMHKMDGVNVLQHPLVGFLPIIGKTDLAASAGENSPTAGYPSVEFDTASTPISPTLALVAGAETKLATTLCDAAITVA
jgi:hypothetical protein